MDLTTPQTTNATTPRTEAETPGEHYDGNLQEGDQSSVQQLDSVAMARAIQEGRLKPRHVSQMLRMQHLN